jgi:coenzyme PQQ biosynthesis protein PqqD
VRARTDASLVLRLAPGFRLDHRNPAGGVLVTSGDGIVQLNDMAVTILAQCDGTRSASDIARAAALAAPVPDRAREDVLEFLAMAREIGWIVAVT